MFLVAVPEEIIRDVGERRNTISPRKRVRESSIAPHERQDVEPSDSTEKESEELQVSNDPAHAVCSNEQKTYTNEGNMFQLRNCVLAPTFAVRTANTNANGHGIADDVTHTIDGAQGQAVAFRKSRRCSSVSDFETWKLDERTNTLNGFEYTDIRTTQAIAEADFEVRRLTVNECELLQGFPAGYTDIEYWGKPSR